MSAFLWVALGGSLGAVARYGAGELISRIIPSRLGP